ncbi:MAG: dihydropteridine reductase [Clostridiales bacterium]|nr:dihydropteridine reductase [Clostridiales bacterium]
MDSIRRQYETRVDSEQSKLERIRELDRRVKNGAMITSLTVGIIGALIFGTGLSMVLEFGQVFLGVIISVVGAIPMIIAYPLYKGVLKKNKKKFGEEILRLSKELLKENEK